MAIAKHVGQACSQQSDVCSRRALGERRLKVGRALITSTCCGPHVFNCLFYVVRTTHTPYVVRHKLSSRHPSNADKGSNEKKSFDSAEAQLVDMDEEYADLCANVDWLVQEEWYREECQKTPGLIESDADIIWKDMQKPGSGKTFRFWSNIPHLRVYRGMNERTGNRNALQTQVARRARLKTGHDVVEFQRDAVEAKAKHLARASASDKVVIDELMDDMKALDTVEKTITKHQLEFFAEAEADMMQEREAKKRRTLESKDDETLSTDLALLVHGLKTQMSTIMEAQSKKNDALIASVQNTFQLKRPDEIEALITQLTAGKADVALSIKDKDKEFQDVLSECKEDPSTLYSGPERCKDISKSFIVDPIRKEAKTVFGTWKATNAALTKAQRFHQEGSASTGQG